MKSDFAFWVVVGIGVGASVGMYNDNLPAGLSFGAAAGIIMNLLSGLNLYQRHKKIN